MKKICTKEVFVCTTYVEVLECILNDESIYYNDEVYGNIRDVTTYYDNDDERKLENLSEDEAKEMILIYSTDASEVRPQDFYVERIISYGISNI